MPNVEIKLEYIYPEKNEALEHKVTMSLFEIRNLNNDKYNRYAISRTLHRFFGEYINFYFTDESKKEIVVLKGQGRYRKFVGHFKVTVVSGERPQNKKYYKKV